MNNLIAHGLSIGAAALAITLVYAAWHEYRLSNRRDAKLLASVGAFSLLGSAAAYLS